MGPGMVRQWSNVATVWKALGDYMDSAPIGYHILVRAAYNLSGQWDERIRLLSAGAVAAAMLVLPVPAVPETSTVLPRK